MENKYYKVNEILSAVRTIEGIGIKREIKGNTLQKNYSKIEQSSDKLLKLKKLIKKDGKIIEL